MSGLKRIIAIMEKEIIHIFRDNVAWVIAFLAPVLLTLFVGLIYLPGKVTHVPILIYDQNQTDVSRSIIRSFVDSERFDVIMTVDNYRSMERAVQSEKVSMALVIPANLKRDIKTGRSAQVGIILNATNLVLANTVANAANQVVSTLGAGITMRIMEGSGISKPKAYEAVTALGFRTRYWYNPGMSYLNFMLLGLAGVIVQQLTFLGLALSFSREKENGAWQPLKLSKMKSYEMFIGKNLVYLIIYSFDALLVYGISFYGFAIPMRGNIGLLMLTIGLFMVALTAMGMAVSILAKNSAQAIELSMLVAVPSFLISGYTWPQIGLIPLLQFLSKLLPLTYFLEAMREVAYLGAGLDVIAPKLVALGVFAVIFIPLTAVVLNWQLAKA